MSRPLLILAFFALALTSTRAAAEWSPADAARYLDERQAAWFAWKPAVSPDGPCVSCHTGMTYLLARPALRRVLQEPEPTVYERGLLDRLRTNAGHKPEGALQAVETIFTAMFLAGEDPADTMSAHTRRAFDQFWAMQEQDGSWPWYPLNLDPWETPASIHFGTALAVLAIGSTPHAYRQEAMVQRQADAARSFVAKTPAPSLHDRLALLWAASKDASALPKEAREAIVADAFARQQTDGGWTVESLGPWRPHPDAPPQAGSSSYATAFTAFALVRAGVPASHPGLSRALGWLESHQDAKTGAWPAHSMNKRYPGGSMQELFMQDAATAFAALALIESAGS